MADCTHEIIHGLCRECRRVFLNGDVRPYEKAMNESSERLVNTNDTLKLLLKGEPITCARCGDDDVPAVCVGEYEGHGGAQGACGNCCAHGNEDGWCLPLTRGAELAEETFSACPGCGGSYSATYGVCATCGGEGK